MTACPVQIRAHHHIAVYIDSNNAKIASQLSVGDKNKPDNSSSLSGMSKEDFERLLWENRDIVSKVLGSELGRSLSTSSGGNSQQEKQAKKQPKETQKTIHGKEVFSLKSPSEMTTRTQAIERMDSSGKSSDLSLNQSQLGRLSLNSGDDNNSCQFVGSGGKRNELYDAPPKHGTSYAEDEPKKLKLPPLHQSAAEIEKRKTNRERRN